MANLNVSRKEFNPSLQNIPQNTQDIYRQYAEMNGVYAAEQWLKQQMNESPPLSLWDEKPSPETVLDMLTNDVGYQDTRQGDVEPSRAILWDDSAERQLEQDGKLFPTKRTTKTAYAIYVLLNRTAKIIAKSRGYSDRVTFVSFFCPQEIIASSIGVHRTTVWRNCQKLAELGYLDAKAHYTSMEKGTVKDGVVWKIKLDLECHSKARLEIDELKAQYRNLTEDVKNGRTAYNFSQNSELKAEVQQSYPIEEDKIKIKNILDWALPPETYQNPVNTDCCITEPPVELIPCLEDILLVGDARKGEEQELVRRAAQAISIATDDRKQISMKFYYSLLWNLLRRQRMCLPENNMFQRLYNAVCRVKTDKIEGFARNAGALLQSRLKQWPEWDDIQRTPRTRICSTM